MILDGEKIMESSKYQEVETERLHPNSWNPFSMKPETLEELVQDVLQRGIQYPITVRPCKCEMIPGGHYEIIDGEHRYIAATDRRIDSKSITCKIEEKDDIEARLETINLNRLRGDRIQERFEKLIMELESKYSLSKEQIAKGFHMRLDALQMELKPVTMHASQTPKIELKARGKAYSVSARLHSRKEFEFISKIMRSVMEKDECDEGSALMAIFQEYEKSA